MRNEQYKPAVLPVTKIMAANKKRKIRIYVQGVWERHQWVYCIVLPYKLVYCWDMTREQAQEKLEKEYLTQGNYRV